MAQRSNRTYLLGAVVLAFFVLSWAVTYYTDWLWYKAIAYDGVFWKTVQARFTSGVLFGLLAAVVVGANLYFAGKFTRFALETDGSPFPEGQIPGEGLLRTRRGYILAAAVLVFVLGNIGSGQWPVLWRYLHAQSFGTVDPIFGRDIGFYVFALPFYQFLVSFLIGAVVVSAVVVVLIYVGGGGIRVQPTLQVMPRALGHLSGLGGAFMLLIAWNYRLKIYDILYATNGTFSGASYIDVNVQVWAYWLLVIVFLATSGIFFVNVRRRDSRYPVIGLGVLVGGAVVIGSVPGAVVQKLLVDPNELEKEAPYIQNNIDATRQAYGLDRIEEQSFEAEETLTRQDIESNPLTLRNVRVWDQPPMTQAYQQIQEIRPYYVFTGVDVDRYTIDGVYRQVMLAGRELDTRRLPDRARNWVNERLQYTHGYGVAMSPVNRITPEGLPDFFVRDIPPVVSSPDLTIDRPEIYYGERTYGNVVVKSGTEEFDYPKGDDNVFTTYEGAGGVRFGTLLNRLAFTIRFMDPNLLLSGYILRDSRVMFNRQIVQRAQTVAPFLHYDGDPYLVIVDGKLKWILDAYTTTDMYPYSTRTGGRSRINYIRNSVKVVVDAYNGSVTFYQADPTDPVANVYAEIFPDLLRPISEMPEELRSHVRYPIDLFRVQAFMYQTYHMNEVQVFYNQEDLWEIPNEIYSDTAQRMEPYYIIVKLPGETREEFLLMVPYTPSKRDNMIAWFAARCDGDNYGDLLVYKLPKDKLIFGPMQLEARIDQQPEISSQLTLWGQRGSQVIRGNLLAIPIERSFLYVEPIYLQARQESEQPQNFGQQDEGGGTPPQQQRGQGGRNEQSTAIPELKQVIVAFGGRVVMRETLNLALMELFGTAGGVVARDVPLGSPAPTDSKAPIVVQSAATLAADAEAHYQAVREAMQAWDWSKAGEEMKALEKAILDLRQTLGQ